MNPKTWLLVTIFVFVAIIAPFAHADEAAETEVNGLEQVTSRAIEMYQQANTLYLNQKYDEAYVLYKAAWALRPNYKVAGNLGNCEYDLRRYRDAAEHLAFALRENPEQGIDATRAYFAERQADAKRYIATLQIDVDNAGSADVYVDSQYIGKAPLGHPIYVDPGTHFIHARNKFASGHAHVAVKRGETRQISLHILPPPSRPPPPVESTSTETVFYAVGSGLSLALLVGGAYMATAQPTNPWTSQNFGYTWGALLAAGGVGLVSLNVVYATTRNKETSRVTTSILPIRENWHVGIQGTF
jgi:tetratricopeptide (TPR) repeat protein